MDKPLDSAAEPPKREEMAAFVAGEVVVVRCAGLRCLAYRDAGGIWRDAYHGEALPEVLDIVSEQ